MRPDNDNGLLTDAGKFWLLYLGATLLLIFAGVMTVAEIAVKIPGAVVRLFTGTHGV